MKIVLVAAIGKEHQLGLNNELLWKLPGDLPRFKAMTMGSPIIMGRKTYDSIGRPLPGRKNIVISRNVNLCIEDVVVVNSVEAAINSAATEQKDNVFVIGGGEIYSLFLPVSDVLELTLVDDSPQADAFFPDFISAQDGKQKFQEIARQTNQTDHLRYDYVRYERVPKI